MFRGPRRGSAGPGVDLRVLEIGRVERRHAARRTGRRCRLPVNDGPARFATEVTLTAFAWHDRASLHEREADLTEFVRDGERFDRPSGLVCLDEAPHQVVESRERICHVPIVRHACRDRALDAGTLDDPAYDRAFAQAARPIAARARRRTDSTSASWSRSAIVAFSSAPRIKSAAARYSQMRKITTDASAPYVAP